MKSFTIKYLLVLLLFSSSQCGFLDDILCGIKVIPLENSLETDLDFSYIETILGDCKEYVLKQLSETKKCLYEFGKELINNGKKLFNIEIDLTTISFNKEIKILSNEKFDVFAKIFLDSDITINSNDDASFTIGAEAELGKNKIDIENPLISKIQELTGFDLEEISLNIKNKLSIYQMEKLV